MKGGLRLVAAALLAGLLLTGTLIYRSHVAAQVRATDRARQEQVDELARRTARISRDANQAVCRRVHRLVLAFETLVVASASPAQLRKSAYYREHPDEVAAAHARAVEFARQIRRRADCVPSDLPGSIP